MLSTCNAVKVQREMVKKLRTFLADECITAANQINKFAEEQATEAKTGRDTIIVPQFECLQKLVTSLSIGADELDQCLLNQVCTPVFCCTHVSLSIYISIINTDC